MTILYVMYPLNLIGLQAFIHGSWHTILVIIHLIFKDFTEI